MVCFIFLLALLNGFSVYGSEIVSNTPEDTVDSTQGQDHSVRVSSASTISSLTEKLFTMTEMYKEGILDKEIIKKAIGAIVEQVSGLSFEIDKTSTESNVPAKLDLKGSQLSDQAAKKLAEFLRSNPSLNHMDLSNNQIGPQGAKSLAKALRSNSSLTYMNLSYNKIGFQGAKSLAKALLKNSTLKELYLSNTQIEDQGTEVLAKALRSNYSLTYIDLSYNKISPQGAKDLAEVLRSNSSLVRLHLSSNEIRDQGAEILAKALLSNSSLKELDLSYNQIRDEGRKILTQLLDERYANLKIVKLDHLELLNLRERPHYLENYVLRIEGADYPYPKKLPSVRTLQFSSYNLQDLIKTNPTLFESYGGALAAMMPNLQNVIFNFKLAQQPSNRPLNVDLDRFFKSPDALQKASNKIQTNMLVDASMVNSSQLSLKGDAVTDLILSATQEQLKERSWSSFLKETSNLSSLSLHFRGYSKSLAQPVDKELTASLKSIPETIKKLSLYDMPITKIDFVPAGLSFLGIYGRPFDAKIGIDIDLSDCTNPEIEVEGDWIRDVKFAQPTAQEDIAIEFYK